MPGCCHAAPLRRSGSEAAIFLPDKDMIFFRNY
jgi:hypothetical protein